MRKAIVAAAAVAVALAVFGCAKKPEEPTAETAAPAMTVDDAKGRLAAVLEEVENLRAGVKEPTAELATAFKDNVAKLEVLHGELAEIEAPEAEAAAYAEVTAKVEAAKAAVDGLAKVTEEKMAEKPAMTKEEVEALNANAKAKFLEACEYAAPAIAAKLTAPPAEEKTK
jgi:hypothetical protein